MTFVVVNFGENQQQLFNPNCKTRLLLENIKSRCRCPNEMEVDLSDEFGNLKNIARSPEVYANQVLSVERENLVLIHVKRNDAITSSLTALLPTTDDVTYIPLLKNDEIVTARFTARLGSRESPSSRPESRAKKPLKEKRNKFDRRSIDATSGDGLPTSTATTSYKRSGSSKKRNSTPTRSKSRGKPR